jgi:hypothetical protein
MANVKVGRRRVESGLDPQALACLEALDKLRFHQDFVGASFKFFHLLLNGSHWFS